SSGRTVTITAAPDTGFALESLTVLDSRGNEIALTDKGDGKYTFTMPASRVTVEASFTPAPLPFEDVAPGAWYEEAVRYAYFHNIMEGMSETEFSPTTALTRAMAVQILYNLEGQPDLSDENLGYPYEDVDAQAWYGNAVYWARITGVATGYGDGTFQPTDSITRQEFAQMLYNYAKYKGYDLTAAGDLSQFPDSESVADWAETAMSWANGNELINGHDDGTIDAAGIGTRAQAASILMQFDQNLVEN
ncbi:MAG: S-layer homology domain-containing protein, partial [Acutalibacter sp.]